MAGFNELECKIYVDANCAKGELATRIAELFSAHAEGTTIEMQCGEVDVQRNDEFPTAFFRSVSWSSCTRTTLPHRAARARPREFWSTSGHRTFLLLPRAITKISSRTVVDTRARLFLGRQFRSIARNSPHPQ
jgi:hypothetical protein